MKEKFCQLPWRSLCNKVLWLFIIVFLYLRFHCYTNYVFQISITTILAVRNSTGTSFAVAFSAMRSADTRGECLIYISAMQTTDITVSSDFEDSTHTVNTRDTLKLSYDCARYRLEEGFENKAS